MNKLSRNSSGRQTGVILANIGALLTICAWGCSFLSSKVLMIEGGWTPVETYVYRFAVAYLLLLLFTFKKLMANNWRDELLLFICGLCAGSLYFITENYALKFTSTGNVSLLASISPLLTTALMAIIYKVKMKMNVILGSVMAFIGVGCVIFSHGEMIEFNPKGDLLALTAALSWAVYSITVKRIIPLYNTFFITRKLFFYGVISALPLLLTQSQPLHFNILFDISEPRLLLNFLFLVVFCSLGAYIIWNLCMKILGAVKTNNYIYAQPLITMIVAYFVFGEKIYVLGYVGCVLIVGGLIISDKLKMKNEN